MRELSVLLLACWLCMGWVTSAHAGSHAWSSLEGDFNAGLWLEELTPDRQEGEKGSRITAEGEGYRFHAVVASSEPVDGCLKTTYADGNLTLASDGPWLHEGSKLFATGLTATGFKCPNSIQDCPNDLCFKLTSSGFFDDLPCLQLDLEISYSGNPEGGPNNAYLAGKLTSAEITLVGPDPDKMAQLRNEIANTFTHCTEAAPPGRLPACVAQRAMQMKSDLAISGAQKVAIQSCATHAVYSRFEAYRLRSENP